MLMIWASYRLSWSMIYKEGLFPNRGIRYSLLFCVTLVLFALWSPGFSQSRGSIRVDSSRNFGVRIYFNPDSAVLVGFQNAKGHIEYYTPDANVDFNIGRMKFRPASINVSGRSQLVFAEELANGDLTLLRSDMDPEAFYLVKADQQLRFIGSDLSTIVRDYCKNCKNWGNQLGQLPVTQRSISTLFNYFNKGKCISFPFAQIGLSTGLHTSILFLRPEWLRPAQDKQAALTVDQLTPVNENIIAPTTFVKFGVFIEQPFWINRLTFNVAAFYSRQQYQKSQPTEDLDQDLRMDLSLIELSISLKNYWGSGNTRIFLMAGINGGRYIKSESVLYQAYEFENEVQLFKYNDLFNGYRWQFGFDYGGGVTLLTTDSFVLSTELRGAISFSANHLIFIDHGLLLKVGIK